MAPASAEVFLFFSDGQSVWVLRLEEYGMLLSCEHGCVNSILETLCCCGPA